MTFYIIGAGNIAFFFAQQLVKAGHICKGVYNRNKIHAHQLAQSINGNTVAIDEIKDDADCCIIAVSDSAVASIAQQLQFQEMALVHTSGTLAMEILDKSSPHCAVAWPVYSIAKAAFPSHRNIPVIWEASTPHAAEVVKNIAAGISDVIYPLSSAQRKWLHLSAVFGNNFSNHIMAICERQCKDHQIPFSLLYPILQQTFEQVQTQSPLKVQTGPAKRDDINVMQEHLHMLADKPLIQNIYSAISASIHSMYGNDEADTLTKP